MKRPIIFNGEVVTEPVPDDVRRAIREFNHAHIEEFASVLSPYGLEPNDILEPDYQRFIAEDEAPIFAKLAADFRNGQP